MRKLSSKEHAKIRANTTVNAGISAPGSRNVWYMAVCKVHGNTSHQTPFGCEQCQRERLVAQGLVKP
jgi:hypothetical protein